MQIEFNIVLNDTERSAYVRQSQNVYNIYIASVYDRRLVTYHHHTPFDHITNANKIYNKTKTDYLFTV